MPSRNFTVIEVTVKFRYDWDNVSRKDIGALRSAMKAWCKAGKYGGKIVSFLVVTRETSAELVERLRDVVGQITSVEEFWCQTAGADGVGIQGEFCPFRTRLIEALDEVRKRNYPKKVPNPRARNIWLDHGVDIFNRKDAIKAGMKPRPDRES